MPSHGNRPACSRRQEPRRRLALNVFITEQAAAELLTFRAIAAAGLHSLVFQRDYRIVAATADGPP